MKIRYGLVLTLAMAFGLSACAGGGTSSGSPSSPDPEDPMSHDLLVVITTVTCALLTITPLGRRLGLYSGEGADSGGPDWFWRHYGRPTWRFDLLAIAYFAVLGWSESRFNGFLFVMLGLALASLVLRVRGVGSPAAETEAGETAGA